MRRRCRRSRARRAPRTRPGRLLDVEELVEPGPAHVRGDEPGAVHRLREDEAERGRDLGLALAVERARHEHGSLARRAEAAAERRLERLVRLVLVRAERVGPVAEPAADVGHLDEHGQLEQPAELPGAADPRLQLRAGEHDERGDEDGGEEREQRVAQRGAGSTAPRRLGRLGERELGAGRSAALTSRS